MPRRGAPPPPIGTRYAWAVRSLVRLRGNGTRVRFNARCARAALRLRCSSSGRPVLLSRAPRGRPRIAPSQNADDGQLCPLCAWILVEQVIQRRMARDLQCHRSGGLYVEEAYCSLSSRPRYVRLSRRRACGLRQGWRRREHAAPPVTPRVAAPIPVRPVDFCFTPGRVPTPVKRSVEVTAASLLCAARVAAEEDLPPLA